jgi:hypothetical protein
MHEHRASMWDWYVAEELQVQKEARLRKARRLCMECPLKAKCLDLHSELVSANRMFSDRDNRVPGVWGGRIFADSDNNNDTAIAA